MSPAGLLEIEEARRIVLEAAVEASGVSHAQPVELEAALGRVLAEPVSATEPVPGFDSSAMDGYAVRRADVLDAEHARPVLLRLTDESRAGIPAATAVTPGGAIAISTGAMIPPGADAIVRVEDTRALDGAVEVLLAPAPEQDIRRAGEDIAAGELVLAPGAVLGAGAIGVLASLGRVDVRCASAARVSLLTSGDELLRPGEPSRAGAVRDSNSFTLSALVRCAGARVTQHQHVGDDAEATERALAEALSGVDVAVICGGISVGAHDHVKAGLRALGVDEAFWGLALKPGRPTWFGTSGRTLVFGLPGNPVSAMVTFILLVRPALRAMLGAADATRRARAVMDVDYEKPAGRAHAVRCTVAPGDGGWRARPTGPQGSHVLTSMLAADALAIVPTAATRIRAGELVELEPLRGETWPLP